MKFILELIKKSTTMKKIVFILLLIFTVNEAIAQNPPLAWSRKIEGVDQNSSQCAVNVNAVDEQGAIYCGGYFRDTLRPDQNQASNYLVGNSNWDSGAFIKYDANGNLIWAKSIVARVGYFYVSDLDIDQFHNVYILCQAVYTDTIDFDPSANVAQEISDGNDFFMAKYDENGNYLWSKRLNVVNGNSTFSNTVNAITVDNNQNIFIGGRFQNQIDLDPGAATLIVTNPGGTNCNCTVGFYAKYDTDGNVIWGFSDNNNSGINAIDINENTGQILIGATAGAFNGATLRLCNSAGTTLYSLSSSRIKVTAVKFDHNGNFYFSGNFNSAGNDFDWGTGDFFMTTPASYETVGFVGKYDSLANFQWAKEFDPTLDPSFRGIYYNVNVDAENKPIVAYGESNGNGYRKGFFKLNETNGTLIWDFAVFNVSVGLNDAVVLPSAFDGTVVFGAGIGFTNNAVTTFDVAPDPNETSNITGIGYWSLMAKYGNCVAAPATPSLIVGNTSLCNTDSITYTIPLQVGVTSYNWSLPAGWTGVSTTNTINVLPASNGGNIEVQANNLCGVSAASTLQVNYIGAPNVQATASTNQICFGDSAVLTGTGADVYSWDNNVLNGVAFAPTSTTSYIVSGTLNGCTNTDTIAITVNSLPLVTLNLNTIDTLCQDAGVISLIGESPSGGVFSGIGVTANSFDALTSGMGNYQITYTYTDANACTNTAVDSIYVDVCTNIAESISDANWTVYPNPCESEFMIYTNQINNAIWVTDLLGKVIVQPIYNQTTVNLHIAESGVYIVFMKTQQSVSQKKIIIN